MFLLLLQAISSGLIDLELSITSLATESHHVPKLLSNLRLTAAFSTMVQSYVQWRGPGVSTETQRIWQSLQGLVGALVRYLMLLLTALIVGRFCRLFCRVSR